MTQLNIDDLVNKFLLDKQQGIVNLYNIYLKKTNISYKTLIEELFDYLKEECLSINNPLEDLDSHLFYLTNDFCKKKYIPPVKKPTEYICPGCLFLGDKTLITSSINLICYECSQKLKVATDIKWINLFKTFKNHSKVGFRCHDCKRFIPQPLDNNIICPYIDCCFVGTIDNLKKMIHPTADSNIKIIDKTQLSLTSVSKIETSEKFKILNEVIDQQINTHHWDNLKFTIKYKVFVYQAFKNILNKYPIEMVSYLLDNSRSGGFQHKIFQEFIYILEQNFPISLKKDGKIYQISSLLDENLSLFEGISNFTATVNDKCCIKNNTIELYIGGRTGAYVKPYYIGKLLNIVELESKNPIMHHVQEYSFSKIKLKDIAPNTNVTVTHLRIPPHYQMGGMVYVNRVRKIIIDKVLLDINNV